MEKISLYLIDDHKLFLEGLCTILQEKSNLEVIGYANCAEEYLKESETIHADVFLIDVNMPEMSGIELTKLIKENDPKSKIIALSMYEDSLYIEKMIQSGASGYVIKSSNITELEHAIQTVAAGNTYLGEKVQEVVYDKMGSLDFFETIGNINKNKLSKREIQILSLIAREYTTYQIASELCISELTVETHRKNILAKTKAKSIVGLVKYAIREGLVDY